MLSYCASPRRWRARVERSCRERGAPSRELSGVLLAAYSYHPTRQRLTLFLLDADSPTPALKSLSPSTPPPRASTPLVLLPIPHLLLLNTQPSMSSSLSSRRLLPNLLPSSHVPPLRPNLYLRVRRSVALPSSMCSPAPACLSPTTRPTPSSMTFIRTFTAGSSRAASPHDEEGSKRANARKAAEIARDFRT